MENVGHRWFFAKNGIKMYSNFIAGNLEMVKFLIKSGVDVNAKDSLSRTAIHLASRKGNLFRRSPWNIKLNLLLYLSAARVNIVNVLIENGAEVKRNPALLYWAIKGGSKIFSYFKTIWLISLNIIKKFSFLCNSGNLQIIELLIKAGGDVKDPYLLQFAIEEGIFMTLNIIHEIRWLFKVNSGRVDIFKILIDNGANINSKVEYNRSPLHVAVLKGNNLIWIQWWTIRVFHSNEFNTIQY